MKKILATIFCFIYISIALGAPVLCEGCFSHVAAVATTEHSENNPQGSNETSQCNLEAQRKVAESVLRTIRPYVRFSTGHFNTFPSFHDFSYKQRLPIVHSASLNDNVPIFLRIGVFRI